MMKLRGENHPRWKGGVKAKRDAEQQRRKSQLGSCCEICARPDNLRWDHNHTTGKYRGTLCDSCNRGISFFFENTTSLGRAIKYLTGAL
jgi:hypothetical protein